VRRQKDVYEEKIERLGEDEVEKGRAIVDRWTVDSYRLEQAARDILFK